MIDPKKRRGGKKRKAPAKRNKAKSQSKTAKAKKRSRKFRKRAKKDDYQGSNGLYKIKFHALWTFLLQMRKYGSATNFHGGPGEEHHKENVKKSGSNTQKRPTSYTCQVSQRSGESNIIAYVHRFVEEFCVPPKKYGRGDANYTANENSEGMNTNDC